MNKRLGGMNKRFFSPTVVTAALLVILAGLVTVVQAQIEGPSKQDQEIAKLVCRYLQAGHYTHHKIDDEISGRLFEGYLDALDPFELYFEASDIEEFSNSKTKLDELIVKGDLSFAFRVYERFRERFEKRMSWAHELADSEQDYDKKERLVIDPDAASYAKDETQARERWRRQIKYELLMLIVTGSTEEEAREQIHRKYRNLEHILDLDKKELVEMFLTALTNSFDPHSTYMSPETLANFQIDIQLKLEGIGALLASEDGITVIKKIIRGGVADKDGRLKPGDKIVGAGQGEDGEIVALERMKLHNVVKLIRGKAGTVVRLEIIRAENDERVIYPLTRQKIELHEREAKGKVIEFSNAADPTSYSFGVITLPTFYADNDAINRGDKNAKTATRDVSRFLKDFEARGVDGVIIDLRGNGGGLLNEAIKLTGLFIDQGPVVQVRGNYGPTVSLEDKDSGVAYGGPLMVLVSRFSASASEIFAGAIKDYGRGIIVGDSTTHGKGTVQKVHSLNRLNRFLMGNLGALKLTMQQFYRVNGQSTQNRGVPADVVLPAISDHEDFGEAKLDYALSFHTIPEAPYVPMAKISSDRIRRLQSLSDERQKNDEELQKLVRMKQKIHERRDRKFIEFTKESLLEERRELELDDDQENSEETEGEDKKDKEFGSDPYTKEVLAVMADYLNLMDGATTTSR